MWAARPTVTNIRLPSWIKHKQAPLFALIEQKVVTITSLNMRVDDRHQALSVFFDLFKHFFWGREPDIVPREVLFLVGHLDIEPNSIAGHAMLQHISWNLKQLILAQIVPAALVVA